MKKVISIFLAALMMLACAVPAFAADGTVNVSFIGASDSLLKDDDGTPAYKFVKSKLGAVDFVKDENGVYAYVESSKSYRAYYKLTSSELEKYKDRYSPVEMTNTSVASGTVITFQVLTNRFYNPATVAVFVNGQEIQLNESSEYSVIADKDLVINVAEVNSNNEPSLLKNNYSVTWSQGDGYRIRTLENQNYRLIEYGGEFYFRVKAVKGYTMSGMTVTLLRNIGNLEKMPEELGNALAIMGKGETLSSYGTDAEGYRLYKITDITSDCRLYVTGVQQEQSAGILAKLKRILRMILNLLGIKVPSSLEDKLTDRQVTVDATAAGSVTYEVVCSGAVNVDSGSFLVLNGDTATVKVKSKTRDGAIVSWTPGNEAGSNYQAEWIAAYDYLNCETYYEAVFNVENITADTVITIKER